MNPLTVKIYSEDREEDSGKDPNLGYLVSRYIGAKVFLNIFTEVFGFPPTKVKLFMTSSYEHDGQLKVIEVPTKTGTKRLVDYGIEDGSKLFII